MKEPNGQRKLSVRYERASEFRLLPVTGIVGGVTPNGEVVGNFFLEQPQYPSQIEVTLDQAGNKMNEEGAPDFDFKREIVVGVILNPRAARSIGNWFIAWADRAMKAMPKELE